MAKETGITKPHGTRPEYSIEHDLASFITRIENIPMVKKLQISFGAILFSSPLLWLWDMPALAGKIALSALYALVILFIYRKWIM